MHAIRTIKRRTWYIGAICALLLTMSALQVASMRGEVQTVDEGVHLSAGYSYWKTGDFRMNPEHPPLIKLIASVPLLFRNIHLPTDTAAWQQPDQWAFARTLLYDNVVSPEAILFAGRLPMVLLTFLLGALIALWSYRLWGFWGGLLSTAAYAFDPNFLAHGRYVTTDVGLALFFLGTVFLFERYLAKPSRGRLVAVAVVFAAAQVAKFSALFLWPLLLLLWLLAAFTPRYRSATTLRRGLTLLATLIATTALVVWTVYGFQVKRPLSDPGFAENVAKTEKWTPASLASAPTCARFILTPSNPNTSFGNGLLQFIGNMPVPAYSYFAGLGQVYWHDCFGHGTYFMGMEGTNGWWQYFPVMFAVKTPLATLLFFALALLYLCRLFLLNKRERSLGETLRALDPDYLFLLVPFFFFFAVTITSKINLGVRHLFPAYPFLFVLIGMLTTIRFRKVQRWWNAILSTMLATLVVSSSLAYPSYLAYFNAGVGGPDNGPAFATDSNLDWGQELGRLGDYLRRQDARSVAIAYFGQAPLERYVPTPSYLPTNDDAIGRENFHGWAAVSATLLFGPNSDYAWLRAFRPAAKIGYAIYVYHF